MAGKRQPLAVVEGNGRKHLTKAEIFGREQVEVKPATPKFVYAPSFLPESLRKEFRDVSKQLIALGIFCKLDRDTLGMYLMARQQYLAAASMASKAMTAAGRAEDALSKGAAGDEASLWAGIQDKYFKQARACANDLGLTVTSRCRLVLPKPVEAEDEDPMEQLLRLKKFG